MERYLKWGIALLIAFIVGFLVYTRWIRDDIKAPDPSTLPDFEMPDLGGGKLSSDNLKNGKPVILFYYGPDCEHCRNLADQVRARMDLLKDVELVYITHMDRTKAESFRKFYGFDKFGNVHFIMNDEGQFYEAFGDMHIPSTYLYGKDYKLRRFIRGETSIGDVMKEVDVEKGI